MLIARYDETIALARASATLIHRNFQVLLSSCRKIIGLFRIIRFLSKNFYFQMRSNVKICSVQLLSNAYVC